MSFVREWEDDIQGKDQRQQNREHLMSMRAERDEIQVFEGWKHNRE